MSVETFKEVLDSARAELNDEGVTGQKTPAGPATRQLYPFGYSGAKFDYTFTPEDSGEKAQGASSVDLAPLADGDRTLSSWSDSSTSDQSFFPCNSTPPSSVTSQSHPQDPCSDVSQNELLLANSSGVAKDVGRGLESDWSSEGPSTDLSGGNPNPFDPHTARRESTQPYSLPAGRTYRQMLEIVALPPPEGLHLWPIKVSQLAAELGMRGGTGGDIVGFVLRAGYVNNELYKVIPLIKAFAAAARVFEGRIVAPTTLLPVVLAVHSGSVPLCGIEPVGADANTTRKRSHDEMSSESVPDEEGEEHWECDGDDDDDDDDEPTYRRPRFTEEDCYCRVGNCLWVFNDPRMCMKHRYRHFSEIVSWVCPGPCRGESTREYARFARGDTLKRHLQRAKYADCMTAVLNVLGLESIPDSGTAWLAPFRVGPERPWESPDFQLTDLRIVKDAKMKLRKWCNVALPVERPTRRRRYK